MSTDPFILRAPTPGDAQAVLDLLVARDLADYGVPDITLDDLHDEWNAPSLHLDEDAVLAQAPNGAIIGYAIIHRPGAMGFVSPEHEGQGVGTQLVRWAQQRERALRRPRHGQAAAAANVRARALFDAFGYAYERSYSRMVRRLDGSETERVLAGLDVSPLTGDADAPSVYALSALSFAANPDYVPESLEEFADEHLRAHDHAPELSLLVRDGAELVGFLLARRWAQEAVGFIDLLAVHPQARNRGIGSAMLHTAFARFAADGLREAQLGVASDNPRALRIYERAGMTARFVVDAYHCPVTTAP